jgi:AcrR family transcriptional regulator
MTEQATQQRILTEAHSMFMQLGFRSVSMDDIANRLGISKKTIYLHYADKDELVAAVVQFEFECGQQTCFNDRDRAENAVHEIFLALDMVVEMFRNMNPSIIHDLQKYHPSAYQLFVRYKNEVVYDIIHQNIIRGQKEGVYRSEIQPVITATFRVETMMLPLTPSFAAKLRFTPAQLEEEITLHYLHGLVNAKGLKYISKYITERQPR